MSSTSTSSDTDVPEIDLDDEENHNLTPIKVSEILDRYDSEISFNESVPMDASSIVPACAYHVATKLEIEIDVDQIASIMREVFSLLITSVELFVSQIISTAMGIIRHIHAKDHNLMPGGLIYDEVGSGKTLKMLLIMTGIYIYEDRRRTNDDKCICLVACMDSLMSNWVDQGSKFFKVNVVQSMAFHEIHVEKPIIVTSLTSFSRGKFLGRKRKGQTVPKDNLFYLPKFMAKTRETENPPTILTVVVDEANYISGIKSDESRRNQSIKSLRPASAWFMTGTNSNCRGDDISTMLSGMITTMTNSADVNEDTWSYTYRIQKKESSITISSCTLQIDMHDVEQKMINDMQSVITSKDKAAGHQIMSHYYFIPWKLFPIVDNLDDCSFTVDTFTQLSATAIRKMKALSGNVVTTSDLLATGHYVTTTNPLRKVYVGPYVHKMLYADFVGIVDVMENTDDKIIVFTEFNDEIELLQDVLDCLFIDQVAVISGSTNAQEKSNAVASFTSSPKTRIILVNKKVGEAGLNLQAANWVYMMTIDPDPAKVEQCLGRAARQGQTKPVTWVSLVGCSRTEGTALTKQRNILLSSKDSTVHPKLDIIEMQNQDMIFYNEELKRRHI